MDWFDITDEQVKDLFDKVEEIERANLSKEEQLQLKEQELNKKMAQADILQNSIKAKSILVGAGVGEEEADKLVASIVKEDEQATINSATLFANQFNNIKEVITKKNDVMAFVKASDEYKQIDLTLFPKIYLEHKNIEIYDIIKIYGKVEKRFDNYQIIVSKLINITIN